MKKFEFTILWFVFIWAFLAKLSDCKIPKEIEPLLVSKYIVNGESTPSFYPEDKENTTRVNYKKGPNELLDLGLRKMQKSGHSIKKELGIDRNIIPKFYNSRYVFVRGLPDHKTIYSAYAYLLGMYPYSVNGIDFKPELMGNGENIPLKGIENIRDKLGMGDKLWKNKTMQYYGGNRDFEFLQDPFETYSTLKFEIIKNLMDAKVVFEREYGDELYKEMSKTMRVDTKNIDFFNAIDYLEDYVTAKYNNMRTPYTFDESTDLLIEVYYTHYFKLGLFKDHAFIRVFTHTYFTNLVEELLLKSEADQAREYISLTNENVDTLGLSLHFGNQLTFLAIMHQLYALEEYFPSFGDELTWTLHYRNGEYWVFGEYDGKRLNLESKANSEGEIKLKDFIRYIWSKVYFGDIRKVASGEEDPHDMLDSPDNWREYFDFHYTFEEELLKTRLNRNDEERDDSNTLDLGIHCALLDEMHGADLIKEPEIIYNVTYIEEEEPEKPEAKPAPKYVTRPVYTSANYYPNELRYDYRYPQTSYYPTQQTYRPPQQSYTSPSRSASSSYIPQQQQTSYQNFQKSSSNMRQESTYQQSTYPENDQKGGFESGHSMFPGNQETIYGNVR